MNADEAAAAVAPIIGYPPTREQIALAFLDVDQEAITKSAAKRYRWERWDQETPINNVAAEVVLANRTDYLGGEIYLIYQDDNLMFFQPFHPETGEQISESELAKVAKAHVAQMATETAFDMIVTALVEKIPQYQPGATAVTRLPQRDDDGSVSSPSVTSVR